MRMVNRLESDLTTTFFFLLRRAIFDAPVVVVEERPAGRPWGEGRPIAQQDDQAH